VDTRPGHCRVSVGYDLTTLGTVDALEPYGPEAFSAMMGSWAALIGEYLSGGSN
jgi:hypothetical protein